MARKIARIWFVGIPVLLLTMTVAMVASAEPLRVAKVGDQMASLVTGLREADGLPFGSCASGAPVVNGHVDGNGLVTSVWSIPNGPFTVRDDGGAALSTVINL